MRAKVKFMKFSIKFRLKMYHLHAYGWQTWQVNQTKQTNKEGSKDIDLFSLL